MRKIFCMLLVFIMSLGLVACSKGPIKDSADESVSIGEDVLEEPTVELVTYNIYIPNANADRFDIVTIESKDISAEFLLEKLVENNVLTADVQVNDFRFVDETINIDFNYSFGDIICSMGSAGERMIMGSVVNTFLDAYDAEFVHITVNGEILESGHVVYDFEMSFFEN